MTTTSNPTPSAMRAHRVPPAMWLGLGLTVVAMVMPYVDRATSQVLAGHVHAGYPGYSAARVDDAVSAYLMLLTIVGGLGLVAWAVSIGLVATGSRWARGTATTMFVLGTSVALFGLLVRDTSGDTGLPPLLGWLGVLPCLAGLVAVVQLWRR